MQEVFADNFEKLLPDILDKIEQAKFIAIDTEFPALHLNETDKPSLFDTPEVRYNKVRYTAINTIPVQVGISPFLFEADANVYRAHTYTFHIWPKPFMDINPNIQFLATSFQFFSRFKTDYNKLIYEGIPFLNTEQEEKLIRGITSDNNDLELTLESYANEIKLEVMQWFKEADDNDTFIVESAKEKLKGDYEAKFQIQLFLRRAFDHKLDTEFNEEDDLVVIKTLKEPPDFERLKEMTIDTLVGFSHVYRALIEAKKPIVGHNMFLDMLLLQNSFGSPLPKSYKQFKQQMHMDIPYLVDTKTLSFIIRKRQPKKMVMWARNSLEHVYKYFKFEKGRLLSYNSPYILNMADLQCDAFHNAGYDSYCTGYIFIRMAHYLVATKLGDRVVRARDIMSSEHIDAIQPYMNQINLIRSTVSHLNMAGKDPASTRPPMLVAISYNKELNLQQVAKILEHYGEPEIQVINSKRAMVAVNSWNNAREIMKEVNKEEDIKIEKYNIFDHNKYAEVLKPIYIGMMITGAITICFTLVKHL